MILLSEVIEPSGLVKYEKSRRVCTDNMYDLLQFYLQAVCFHHLT
jgi:hypothetical protein